MKDIYFYNRKRLISNNPNLIKISCYESATASLRSGSRFQTANLNLIETIQNHLYAPLRRYFLAYKIISQKLEY